MRIISQDETYDFPYEQTAIAVYGTEIAGYSLDNTRYCTLARYSTEEKAIKAMEMCREKYLSRMVLDGGYDIVHGCHVRPNYWVPPKVFQFPADEEV